MKRALAVLALAACAQAAAQPRDIPPSALRSGVSYVAPAIAALQGDDAANPGMLWVDRGAQLFAFAPANSPARACSGCHDPDRMRGVAARHPAWSDADGRVIDLEDRINGCRVARQGEPALARGSDDLLALTAFVASRSRGMPVHVAIDGAAAPAFERARAFYHARRGQLDLSCSSCHDQNAGRRLLNETISQGHPTAFPAYRLEWQALGSLQRRLRACLFGIRAVQPAEGAEILTELELYLAWRADGLPLEAPGVRR